MGVLDGTTTSASDATLGRVGGSRRRGLVYPTPFFDIGHTYLPSTVKELFRWCRYYFLVHPIINTIVFKLAQYAVTDIIYYTDNEELKKLWKIVLEEKLKYRAFQIESGLDYHAYGNCLVSIFYPFKKYLKCKNCGKERPITDTKYKFRSFEFVLECQDCGNCGPAEVKDIYVKNIDGIRLIRWNPENINISYNETTGNCVYYYQIPIQLRNDIIMGKRHIIEETPQIYIESLKKRQAVIFSKDNLFHFRRGTLAGKDRGWGTPGILPVLKDAYFLQVVKKSQEAIAVEHIVPLRTLFPQFSGSMESPYNTMNLMDWRDQISEEVDRWRKDNNYMPILSFPVGTQTIGGDGRSLLMSQEIRMYLEMIAIGMGVPSELVFGGVSWSGSNVSLRMLENFFITYISDHSTLRNWIIKQVGAYMDWEPIMTKSKPFKMADDLQRKAYNLQLNQMGKMSTVTLQEDADIDPEEEEKRLDKEAKKMNGTQRSTRLAQADIEGQASLIMTRYQVKAQMEQQQMMASEKPAPGEPGAEAEGVYSDGSASPATEASVHQMSSPLSAGQEMGDTMNVDLVSEAQRIATQISQLPAESQVAALDNIRAQSPQFSKMVESMLVSLHQSVAKKEAPLPQQKAPRREAGQALV